MYGYTNGDTILSALGSFWSTFFKGDYSQLIKDFSCLYEEKIADLYFRFCEVVLGTSIKSIPIMSKESWKLLILKESDQNKDTESILKYGGNNPFNKDVNLKYGDENIYYGGLRYPEFFSYAVDFDKVGEFIVNKIYNSSEILINGKDYILQNNILVFKTNPFNKNFSIRNIYGLDGKISDREISLWIPSVSIDKKDIYKRYGYILNIKEDNNSKEVIESLLELYTGGPKEHIFISFLNAIFGLPMSLEDFEEIQYIVDEQNLYRKIYTEKRIYNLEINEYLNIFNCGDKLRLFTPFYNNINVIDSQKNKNYFKNLPQNKNELNIPCCLLNGEYNLPVKVFYNKISTENSADKTFSFETENVPSDKIDLWENNEIPISDYFLISDNEIEIDPFDFIIKQFESNLIFVELNDVSLLNKSAFLEILNTVIPIFSILFLITKININQDEIYISDINDGILSVNEGHFLSDIYMSNVDCMDGNSGQIMAGEFAEIGEEFVIDGSSFNSGPRILVIERRC